MEINGLPIKDQHDILELEGAAWIKETAAQKAEHRILILSGHIHGKAQSTVRKELRLLKRAVYTARHMRNVARRAWWNVDQAKKFLSRTVDKNKNLCKM